MTEEQLAEFIGVTPVSTISRRLEAAKDVMMAKGHECPSVEVGCEVLGKHGFVAWASVHLGSPKNWVEGWTFDSLEAALDAIDITAASVPTFAETDGAKKAAFAKLSPDERAMPGVSSVV
jgi:hypothetical protein